MFRVVRRQRPQVVHLHDPELLPLGLLLTWYGLTVFYDAHEDVPRQILNKHWIPGPVRPLVSWAFESFENFVANRLAGVVAATPHIAERFRSINPNTVDINNYPLPEELAPAGSLARKRQVCYVGGISRIRGIRPIVEALPLLPEVRLVLCGNFAEADFEEELRALPGWDQVDYLGHVDRDQVRKVMAESVAGLVTLFPIPNYLDSLPIKMFEYMSAELPVIASDFPLWKTILDDAEAGGCVDPKSPQAIAGAIRELLDAPQTVDARGKSGRMAVLTKYNWPTEAAKLIHFYQRVLPA
jgi:glycosyltransferase involved in cell wall biosynthesis